MALRLGGIADLDPSGGPLVAMRAGFLSQEIYGSFGRYALSQLDRLEHNQRLAEHRAIVIGWLREDPSLELVTAAERLAEAARIVARARFRSTPMSRRPIACCARRVRRRRGVTSSACRGRGESMQPIPRSRGMTSNVDRS
jgi:hypothetical protein